MYKRQGFITDGVMHYFFGFLHTGGNEHPAVGVWLYLLPRELDVYKRQLFTRSTFIIKRNDVLLGRHPVVGEDTAVCVYYSEHILSLIHI